MFLFSWEAYHAVFNNKKCNRITVILFCIILIIFFFGLIAFTYVKLNLRANSDDDKRFIIKLTYG